MTRVMVLCDEDQSTTFGNLAVGDYFIAETGQLFIKADVVTTSTGHVPQYDGIAIGPPETLIGRGLRGGFSRHCKVKRVTDAKISYSI